MTRDRNPSTGRLTGVLLSFLLLNGAWLLLARAGMPGTGVSWGEAPLQLALSIFAGAASALTIGSIGEWCVHRYLMHGRSVPGLRLAYDLHHVAHHWVQYRPDEYLHEDRVQRVPLLGGGLERVCRTALGRWSTVLGHVSFYSFFGVVIALLPAWLLTRNPVFTGVVVVLTAVEIYLFVRVHDAVHHPGLSRLERFRWFWFLDRHHYIHHVDNRSNTNFLLPLADWWLGTLRLELTEAELALWPSYGEARSRILRPSFDAAGRRSRSDSTRGGSRSPEESPVIGESTASTAG